MLETNTTVKRKSSSAILKQDYLELEAYKNETNIVYRFITPEERIRKTNSLAYEAYNLLSKSKMEELKWNVKQVTKAVIHASNQRQEAKLLQLLKRDFTVTRRYTINQIVAKLQVLYNLLHIKNSKGETKIAEATDLRNEGWYEIHPCKIDGKDNNKQNGFIILRETFDLRMAA